MCMTIIIIITICLVTAINSFANTLLAGYGNYLHNNLKIIKL